MPAGLVLNLAGPEVQPSMGSINQHGSLHLAGFSLLDLSSSPRSKMTHGCVILIQVYFHSSNKQLFKPILPVFFGRRFSRAWVGGVERAGPFFSASTL